MNIIANRALSKPRISHLGTTGLLFEAPGAFDLTIQRRIWALADHARTWPGVRDAYPGMTNVTILFSTPPHDIETLMQKLQDRWALGEESQPQSRTIEIPIVYGGEGGPHLNDVAEGTGLSIDDVVKLHAEPDYTVYAVGSHAGYCYLGGLNEKLFLPRRKVPLMRIPGGSLSIAGMQTGVSASAGPSGWHTIGHADTVFFDPQKQPPALLKPGDMIRFKVERVIA